jgi:hypothetical protein
VIRCLVRASVPAHSMSPADRERAPSAPRDRPWARERRGNIVPERCGPPGGRPVPAPCSIGSRVRGRPAAWACAPPDRFGSLLGQRRQGGRPLSAVFENFKFRQRAFMGRSVIASGNTAENRAAHPQHEGSPQVRFSRALRRPKRAFRGRMQRCSKHMLYTGPCSPTYFQGRAAAARLASSSLESNQPSNTSHLRIRQCPFRLCS